MECDKCGDWLDEFEGIFIEFDENGDELPISFDCYLESIGAE